MLSNKTFFMARLQVMLLLVVNWNDIFQRRNLFYPGMFDNNHMCIFCRIRLSQKKSVPSWSRFRLSGKSAFTGFNVRYLVSNTVIQFSHFLSSSCWKLAIKFVFTFTFRTTRMVQQDLERKSSEISLDFSLLTSLFRVWWMLLLLWQQKSLLLLLSQVKQKGRREEQSHTTRYTRAYIRLYL